MRWQRGTRARAICEREWPGGAGEGQEDLERAPWRERLETRTMPWFQTTPMVPISAYCTIRIRHTIRKNWI